MHADYSLAQEFAIAASDSPPHAHNRLTEVSWELFVVGAAIVDMIADGHLELSPKGHLLLTDRVWTGEKGHTQLAEAMHTSRKPKTLKVWIKYFYSHHKLRRAVAAESTKPLFDNGTLQIVLRKVLWIFPRRRYTADAAAKDRIIQRLRAEMLEQGTVADQTAYLGMLMEATKLLKPFFSDYERHELKRKLDGLHLEYGDDWNRIKQIRQAIQEIQSEASVIAAAASAGT